MGMQFHPKVFGKLAAWNPLRTRDEAAITCTALALLRDYAVAQAATPAKQGALMFVYSADGRGRVPLWFGPKVPDGSDVPGSTFTEVRLAEEEPLFMHEAPAQAAPRLLGAYGGPGGPDWEASEHVRLGSYYGKLLSDREMTFLRTGG